MNALSDETVQNWKRFQYAKNISQISLDLDGDLDGSMMRVVVFGATITIDIIESIWN